jgi:hypothetical protein
LGFPIHSNNEIVKTLKSINVEPIPWTTGAGYVSTSKQSTILVDAA